MSPIQELICFGEEYDREQRRMRPHAEAWGKEHERLMRKHGNSWPYADRKELARFEKVGNKFLQEHEKSVKRLDRNTYAPHGRVAGALLGGGTGLWAVGRKAPVGIKAMSGLGGALIGATAGGFTGQRFDKRRELSAIQQHLIEFDPRPRNGLGEFSGQQGGPSGAAMDVTYRSGLANAAMEGAAGGVAGAGALSAIDMLRNKLRGVRRK